MVVCATTANDAEPPQLVLPSVDVAVSVMSKPLPAGRPPITDEIVVLCLTSIDPVSENAFGPEIVYATVLNVVPVAASSVSASDPLLLVSSVRGAEPGVHAPTTNPANPTIVTATKTNGVRLCCMSKFLFVCSHPSSALAHSTWSRRAICVARRVPDGGESETSRFPSVATGARPMGRRCE